MTLHPEIWEPACGQGHLAKVFQRRGYKVYPTDLIQRDFGIGGLDFLKCTCPFDGDIITNPPYKYAQEFVEKALSLVPNGRYVIMFLKLQFMEGKNRRKLFDENPPKTIYVSSSRLLCAKNGDFQRMRDSGGSAVAYGWYLWEKGYKGPTEIKWFN